MGGTTLIEVMCCVALIAAVVSAIVVATRERPELRCAIFIVGIVMCLAVGL